MTPICITGADAPALHHLAQALQGAGVAPAQPLQRDAALDLHVWHQRVCQSGALPVVPSRLWEQVAIDLLLSNIDQPVWSWANARSIDALDFWAQLDTNIRFVLLCQTPQQAVAELFAANTGTEADEAHQLALWQQRHQALLRFHLRHPERSVLVWADQARQAPHVLAAHVAQQWQLPLQPDAVIATAQPLPHNAVQLQLAAQLVARHPQHQELERELHASVQPLLAAEANPAQGQPAAPTAQLLVQHYLQLADRSAEQAALQQKQQEADNLLQELHGVQAQLEAATQVQQTEAAAKADALKQLEAETKAKTELQTQLNALSQAHTKTVADLQEAQQEAELLLQQLHQVQEELEKRYLNHQALQTELQAKLAEESKAKQAEAAAKAKVLQQRDAETKARIELQGKLDDLTQTHSKTAINLQHTQQKAEQLLQELHRVQELLAQQLEQYQAEQAAKSEAIHQRNLIAQAHKDVQAQLDAATRAQQAEAAAKAALQKTQADQQAKLDALTQTHTKTVADLQEAQQEGELLLQQLHQVQEELEKYYLNHQAAQAEVQQLKAQLHATEEERNQAVHQRNLTAQDRLNVLDQLKAADQAKTALQAQLDALAEEQAQLVKARDVALTDMARERNEAVHQRNLMAQDRQELIDKLQALAAENTQAHAALQDARQEGELLLRQLHLVQEELESLSQTKAQQSKLLASVEQAQVALQAQLDAHAEERAELIKARDVALTEVAQERNEAVHQRNLIAQARLELVDELQATQQELERITQQLFQVQAELEQQHQREHAAQQLSQSLQARWSRLLEQQPELSDFDVVQLVGPVADGQPLQWQLNHTTVAGRAFEQLNFQTVLENGVAGFVWQRHPSNGSSPLARWPVSARSDDSVTLIPTRSATDTHKRAAHMVQLASSDWELLLALPAVLMQALERGRVPLPAGQRDLWHTALARSAELMRGMQRLVRFDAAELTAQQATPQREVLALRLAPLQFATTRLPELTFQLQLNKAADGGVTSAHFILDAAAQGTALQNWVANVPTATGQAVMALRLDAAGWDAALWQQLTDQDRTFMSALLDSLAVVLVTLQAAGARAERAWADWLKLATRLRQWARATPAPVVATEEPAPAPAELLQAPEAPPAAAPARPRRSSSAKPKAAPAPATRTTTTRKKRAAQP